MHSHSNINVSSLWGKMIVQLSCEEFCALTQFAMEGLAAPVADIVAPAKIHQVVGVTPLSVELGCSSSFLYSLKAKGVLNDAIICHIGRKAVFDVEKARKLADDYQAAERNARK